MAAAVGLAAPAGKMPADPDAGWKPALPGLNAHPLVREHFGRAREEENPGAWRAAHGLLFEWFCAQPEKHQPDILEELAPLYRAAGHGCRAGRYDEALGPRRMSRETLREAGDWSNFCIASYGLVDLLTPLGRWHEAEAVVQQLASQAPGYADFSRLPLPPASVTPPRFDVDPLPRRQPG